MRMALLGVNVRSFSCFPPYACLIVKVRSVSATRVINAPPATVFDLLADPRRHADFDGSTTVVDVKQAPARLYLGATFSMDMKMRIGYHVKNVVVAFEEAKCIAWHHVAQFIWRYDLEEVPGGTKVTESFNYNKPWAFGIIWLGWPERNRRAMEATLERIDRLVTSG
jgi:uncharacterized protein YndB with AHSA1/START domain